MNHNVDFLRTMSINIWWHDSHAGGVYMHLNCTSMHSLFLKLEPSTEILSFYDFWRSKIFELCVGQIPRNFQTLFVFKLSFLRENHENNN